MKGGKSVGPSYNPSTKGKAQTMSRKGFQAPHLMPGHTGKSGGMSTSKGGGRPC